MPYRKDVTDVRCRSHFARAEYVSAESLGRFSLAGGGSLFHLGACRLLPSAVKPCNPFPGTPAARARPSALTLNPSGFVLPVVALAPPRFSPSRSPSPCGLASLARVQPSPRASNRSRSCVAGAAASRVFTLTRHKEKARAACSKFVRAIFVNY